MIEAIHAIGERRDKLDYDIDGAVIRLHEPAAFEAAGFNSAEPRGAIAFKYPPEEKLTKLLAVEWQVGKVGRDRAAGARSSPVFVGGVTVENITLHNPRLIRERDLRIGDTVAVVRRGDVIPFAGRSIPEDRDGSEQVDRAADALPVLRHRARDPRHRRGALVPEPAVPGADHAPADALGLAPGGRHGGRRRRLDREARRRRACSRRRSDFYTLTAEQLIDLRAHGRGVGQEHGGLDRALQGARPAPRAVRPRDPDGLRRHGQALLPGRLRAHRGDRGRDRRGPRRDPRHRRRRSPRASSRSSTRPEVLEEITALRAHGVDLDVHDEDRPVDVAAAADSPLKGKSVVITGAFTDPRSGAKVSRPDVTRLVEQAARHDRLLGLGEHRLPAGRRQHRRGEDREGRQARRDGRRAGRAVALAGRGRAWPERDARRLVRLCTARSDERP